MIETLVGMGETLKTATSDDFMVTEITNLAKRLRAHHEAELK